MASPAEGLRPGARQSGLLERPEALPQELHGSAAIALALEQLEAIDVAFR